MPLVRMKVSVACEDLPSRKGATVHLPAERAQQVVRAGWGEYVRGPEAVVPERRTPQPERAVAAPTAPAPTTETPEATEAPEAVSEALEVVEEAPKPRRRTTTRKKN